MTGLFHNNIKIIIIIIIKFLIDTITFFLYVGTILFIS